MKTIFLICMLLFNTAMALAQGQEPKAILIKNIKLIDGTGGPVLKERSVLVENGVFRMIGHSSDFQALKDVTIVDGKGKTMIPGLVGVHNHLHIPGFPFIGEVASKLYLASGVTTIQTCGAASAKREIALAKKIAAGEAIGPEIIPSGPYITGKGGNPNMIIPQNEIHLRDTIRFWANQGVKWLKVYRNIEPEFLKIVIDEAHKRNLKVTGHLCSVTFKEASEMGIDAIEHGFNSVSYFRSNKKTGTCSGTREYIDTLDMQSKEVDDLLHRLVKNGTALTSTLSIYEASIPSRRFIDERSAEIMAASFREDFQHLKDQPDQKEINAIREKRFKRIMEFEYRFYQKGGILSAGVDAGRHVLPGFGDKRNFLLLLEAGFTTLEAINIMTKNGALKLGRSDIGTIEPGKRADFVILDGDLELDPKVIEKTEKVYSNGKPYDPEVILESLKGKYGE
ncbi:amidohydrolase family protein [Salinimicrobium oceani]|nr:amidohydrolase family protein [Salinimicrobium oceani]